MYISLDWIIFSFGIQGVITNVVIRVLFL